MTDPTIQLPVGPAAESTGSIAASLAEIDAMGRKAARGAGYAWGLAEEAGRAARWLAAHGLPGPELLANLLVAIDGNVAAHRPTVEDSPWSAPAGDLCPVQSGAALSDRADDLVSGTCFSLGPTRCPLLVVPFLCRVARDLELTIAATIGDVTLAATSDGPAWQILPGGGSAPMTVARRERCATTPVPSRPEARVTPVECWRTLDRLAARTCVPATAASRERGAGAGTADSD